MSKSQSWRIITGALILALGVLGLLQNFNLIKFNPATTSLIVGGLFLIGGVSFLAVLITNLSRWWASIPGFILLAIGLQILLPQYLPGISRYFDGSIILIGIALAFWVTYILNVRRWWAIIPAGLFSTLAILITIERTDRGIETGGIVLIGLGLTFVLVALLPNGGRRTGWAWIPGGILFAIGAMMSFSAQVAGSIWAIALIIVGLALILRSLKRN